MSARTKWYLCWILALLPALVCGPLSAQEMLSPEQDPVPVAETYRVPVKTAYSDNAERVWSVTLHVRRFIQNPIGQEALKIADQTIRTLQGARMASPEDPLEQRGIDLKTAREKIGRVLGFDPLEGIESIQIYGLASPFALTGGHARPEDLLENDDVVEQMVVNGIAVVTLTGGPGNLEGFALAAPDYKSTEYDDVTIHSAMHPDLKVRLYMAVVRPTNDRPNVVIFGMIEQLVKQAIDRVKAEARTPGQVENGPFFIAGVKLDEATIRAMQIPEQQSAVFKMLTHLGIGLEADESTASVSLVGHLTDEKRAEQVRQLVAGAVALGELAIEMAVEQGEGGREAQAAQQLLADVKIETLRQGNRVTCRATKPVDTLIKDLFNATEVLDLVNTREEALRTRQRVEELQAREAKRQSLEEKRLAIKNARGTIEQQIKSFQQKIKGIELLISRTESEEIPFGQKDIEALKTHVQGLEKERQRLVEKQQEIEEACRAAERDVQEIKRSASSTGNGKTAPVRREDPETPERADEVQRRIRIETEREILRAKERAIQER